MIPMRLSLSRHSWTILVALVIGCSGEQKPAAKIDTGSSAPASATTVATDSAQDDAHRVGLAFIDSPQPPEFKGMGSERFNIGVTRYTTFLVSASGRLEVWLARLTDTTTAKQPWSVIATMVPRDTLTDDRVIWTQQCLRDSTLDRQLVTVVDVDREALYEHPIRAWSADPVSRRFVEVPPAGIACFNNAAPGADVEESRLQALEEKAETPVPILRPAADLHQLPQSVRDSLTKRDCRVPQLVTDDSRNVLRGNFMGTGRDTWAIWCVDASGDRPRILLFRDGTAPPLPELETTASGSAHIKPYDPTAYRSQRYGCFGSIFRASVAADWASDAILEEGGPLTDAEKKMPPHDGIVDGDCDGTSNVHYWTGKRWILLPGGD